MPVDPTGHDLKRFLSEDPGGPVVMLNLLKYKPDGRAGYERYVEAFGDHGKRFGAEIVAVGDCATALVAPDTHDWDSVLLVRYPSRQAFSDMVRDAGYQQITHLRTEALDAAVLQPLLGWADAGA